MPPSPSQDPTPTHRLTVNGSSREVVAVAGTPLLWILRDHLGLTGSKYGCGAGHCGACMVHLDGRAVPSCTLPVEAVGELPVTTIEGLSSEGSHPVQRAWIAERVPQCGYCQAGQVMSASALLAESPDPTADEVEAAMSANICRCGTYGRIRRAIERAARSIADEGA